VTDEAGDLDGTADYNVYGEVRASSGVSTLFRFTGEQHDGETGFTYLRARYADPALGRFVSADTVQPNAPGTQGYNLYAYVAGNPTTWVDPSGHTALPEGMEQGRQLLTLVLLYPTLVPTAINACTAHAGCVIGVSVATLYAVSCALYSDCLWGAVQDAGLIEKFGSFGPNDVPWDWDKLKDAGKWWPTVPSVGPVVHFGMSRADCLEKFLDCDAGKWNPLKWGPIGKCDDCFANCIVQGKWPDWLCDPNKPKTKDSPFVRSIGGPTCS
jgi:RHS repeat-associated protein